MARAWQGSTRNQEWVPRATRAAVMLRDEGLCRIQYEGCTVEAAEVDHVTPVARGGTHDMGNLQAACAWCNQQKNRHENPGWKRPPTRRPKEQHPGLA
ncbi:HNH endonuclease [Streptomonospora wellingtoniae]|uniref:HNH endonuclease signature motif containing protein n=1 Tax=Streptomonospora wellingtoniae TaxID=3075544 RepID=A0ABU2KUE8_9ACTN|nr:HNH endonuclease signature motif containing protein [Streptomonospora sp. DSM 45055]MDT0302914.1 HNH endonuclease signature motif containing protein [Streptomonospora sp. DSM 45055]